MSGRPVKARAVGVIEPGGYENLAVVEREVREPGPGEVRLAVAAAGVNPVDSSLHRNGDRSNPAPWTPGMDAAGTVDAVGPGETRLVAGMRVMAAVNPNRPEGGAQAEQVVLPAASVVPIPDDLDFVQAATLPMNGLTAFHGLDLLGLATGDTLAVTGGAGLLASYVIGIAKASGLTVLADARPEDEPLVRSFGADRIIARGDDYPAAVASATGGGVDGLLDTAWLHAAAFEAVRDGGAIAAVGGWQPTETERDIRVSRMDVGTVLDRTDWLERLPRLVGDGTLRPRVVGQVAPEDVGEAQRRMDAGGMRGRLVVVF